MHGSCDLMKRCIEKDGLSLELLLLLGFVLFYLFKISQYFTYLVQVSLFYDNLHDFTVVYCVA